MTACGGNSVFIDRRVQFVDIGDRFEIGIDVREHVAQFPQDRLRFEHGKTLLPFTVSSADAFVGTDETLTRPSEIPW